MGIWNHNACTTYNPVPITYYTNYGLGLLCIAYCWAREMLPSSIPLSKSWHPRKTRNAAAATSSILLAAFEKNYLIIVTVSVYTVFWSGSQSAESMWPVIKMLTKRKRKSRPWLVHVPSLDNPHIFQTLQDTGSLPVSLFPGLGCLSMVFRSFGGAVVGSGWVLGSIKVLPLRYAMVENEFRGNIGSTKTSLRSCID